MVLILRQQDKTFEAQFKVFLDNKCKVARNVNEIVSVIIHRVRMEGDKALAEYARQFDEVNFVEGDFRVSQVEIADAVRSINSETMYALCLAHERITAYHKRQIPKDECFTDSLGVELGWRWTAIESVGFYVPGGTASYPSSVLMSAIPARVAGVKRLVMAVPSPRGKLNPLVLAAANLVGVDEIYRIGGAQAIAALAYGTQTVRPVVKIVGPGNAYVAAAKQQVFGVVGIDMIAGPSEILIIANEENNPDWIAADLLAQAEHDAAAQCILITDSVSFADEVQKSIEAQIITLQRSQIALASWRDFGAIILVDNLKDAVPLVNRIAPEHLELAIKDSEALLPDIRNAGAIFLGPYTPEVIGDYVGGSNHVLPTARSARFSSSLSVLDYMKRTSILKLGVKQLYDLGPTAIRLAEVEGLEAHIRSVAVRLNR
ncbi:MAG: histidinol dehydrogenase [Candidatus Tokpelaia sp. JSC188]|nr:MAG: histidinol dehydrogenase [Candidatus Tokpelaia sp. JSC188]